MQFDIVKSVLIILPYMQKREEKSVFLIILQNNAKLTLLLSKH